MIASLFDVVGCHIFEWQHSINVQRSCAGDEVPFIGVFRRQLVSNKVTSVVQVFAIHKIIFDRVPSRWFYLTNGPALFGRHSLSADTGVRYSAAPKTVKLAVILERGRSQIFIGEIWDIIIDDDIQFTAIRRNICQRYLNWFRCSCWCLSWFRSCDRSFRGFRCAFCNGLCNR